MYGFCTPFDDISAYPLYVTVCHAASRCMYAILLCLYTILWCPPPKCVNLRATYEKVVDRSIFQSSLLTFTKFHVLRCSSVGSCSWQSIDELLCETWSHGKREGNARKRSRDEADEMNRALGHLCAHIG